MPNAPERPDDAADPLAPQTLEGTWHFQVLAERNALAALLMERERKVLPRHVRAALRPIADEARARLAALRAPDTNGRTG